MTGKVVSGTHGWRAEQAWPLALYVPHVFWRLVVALEKVYEPYGVRIELDNTLRSDSSGAARDQL